MYRERREHFRVQGQTLISASEGPIVYMWDESSRQVKVVGWFGDGENYRDFFIGDGTQTEFSRTNLDWAVWTLTTPELLRTSLYCTGAFI